MGLTRKVNQGPDEIVGSAAIMLIIVQTLGALTTWTVSG